MLIRVEDTKVVITVATADDGWTFQFSHETGHKAWATLLASSLRRHRDNEQASDWRKHYDQGWRDAKAKRKKATA